MKTVLADIQALERKIAETYESYKKKHPNTKKTRNDPMFSKLQSAQPRQTTHKNPMRDSWVRPEKMSPDDHGKASDYHSQMSDKYQKELEHASSHNGDWEGAQEKRDYHANQSNYHDFLARGDKQMADAYRAELLKFRNPYHR